MSSAFFTGSVSYSFSTGSYLPMTVLASGTGWIFHATGSWSATYENRVGQVVSDGKPDGDNVYLVRESDCFTHVLAHPGGGEVTVKELDFEPFGVWRVLAR